jgi:hypothetical protein
MSSLCYFDCRETASAEEFEELVQRLLAADCGFSWQDFSEFLSTIIYRRLATARQLQQQQQFAEGHQQDEEQQHAAQHDGDLQQRRQQEVCRPADAGVGTATTAGSLTSGAAAAAGCSECESAQMAAAKCLLGLQLQMLHCALDLQRAATLLQQVQQAYAAAAAHNAAWCAKNNSSSNDSSSSWQLRGRQQHGQQASENSVSSCSATAGKAVDGVGALPAWVVDAGGLACSALHVVEQLKQLCHSATPCN